MAYNGLLPGQEVIGGYAPPGAGGLRDGNIIVIEISDAPKKAPGTPRLAFFTYQGMSGGSQGYADANPPASDANIVVDWDPVTKKYIYMKVTLPNTVLVDIYTVPNNAANNKKYKKLDRYNFVYADGKYEYVPDIRNWYVDIINAMYKKGEIQGLSPAKITPEVVEIVDEMLDEIQKKSIGMKTAHQAFELFWGIGNWTGLIRNAKGIDYNDAVEWVNVILGETSSDTAILTVISDNRQRLQIALNGK